VIIENEVVRRCFSCAETAAVGPEIAIDVPKILPVSEVGASTQPSEISIEVPQILSMGEVGLSVQASGQAFSVGSALEQVGEDGEEAEMEEDKEPDGEEEEGEVEEEEEDDVDDDRDLVGRMPVEDEPDDQTGLLPEYMVAESIPSLPAVDGQLAMTSLIVVDCSQVVVSMPPPPIRH